MLLECKSQCWETFTSSWCWDFTSNNQSQRRNSAFIILPPKPGKKAREFCSCWHQTDHFPPDNVVSQGGTSIIFAIITHSFHNEGRVTGGLARSHLLSVQFNWWHCPCVMENPGQGAKGLALNAAPAQLRPLRQHLRSTYARREKVGEVNAFYLFIFFAFFFFPGLPMTWMTSRTGLMCAALQAAPRSVWIFRSHTTAKRFDCNVFLN